MVNIMIAGFIANSVKAIAERMGFEKNGRTHTMCMAFGKCVVTCAYAQNDEQVQNAVEDFINDCGINGWKGNTIACAFMDIYKGARMISDLPNLLVYVKDKFEKLANLIGALGDFGCDETEFCDDYDDAADDDDDDDYEIEERCDDAYAEGFADGKEVGFYLGYNECRNETKRLIESTNYQ